MGPKGTPFEPLQPWDGFTVIDHALGDLESSLHFVLRTDGELKYDTALGPHAEVWRAERPTWVDKGCMIRAQILLEAVARYFTTGGSWEELDSMLDSARPFVQGGMVFEGWSYFTGYAEDDHQVDIFRQDDTEQLVRWVHGHDGYFEIMTIDDRLQELEDDEDDDDTVRAYRALLRQRDLETAEHAGVETPKICGPKTGRHAV